MQCVATEQQHQT